MKNLINWMLSIFSIIYLAIGYFLYSLHHSFLGGYLGSFTGKEPFLFMISGLIILIIVAKVDSSPKTKPRKFLLVFFVIILLLFPVAMMITYRSIPLHYKNYYFEGIDKNTCETGIRTFPWGIHIDFTNSDGKDFCFMLTKQCEKVNEKDSSRKESCYLLNS